MKRFVTACAAALLFWSSPMTGDAQNFPIFNMAYSGAGIGSDLLKVIDRAGLWRKHGIAVRTIYLSSGTLMAQTLSSGDIGAAGFDTPAIQNVIDSLATAKARGARAEDFINPSLMEEIRKSGFMEKLAGK